LRAELVASWWEIAAVLAVVIGPFAGRSTWMALHGSSSHYMNLLLTNSRLLNGIAMEGAILAGLLGYLHWRGWRPLDFKSKPDGWSSFQSFFLFVAVMIGNFMTVVTLLVIVFTLQTSFAQFLPFVRANSPHLKPHSIDVGWIILIGTMILNAFFEEITCMSYAFNQFAAKRGPLFALLLTVLLRMSCHTYQGPIHMLGIGTVFLIFGLWYWRTRNIWTLILAHALLDLASTSFVKLIFG
jgi:membrane protease YdiL (CAAX protease family)